MLPPGIYLHRLMHRLKRQEVDEAEAVDRPIRPEGGPLIWCHVGCLDDLNALIGFLQQLTQTRDDLCFLITHRNGCKNADIPQNLRDLIICQPLPEDAPDQVCGFLDYWTPDLLLWMDHRLEITLLAESHLRGIDAIWINARSPLSDQPALRWTPGTARMIASGFDTILTENEGASAVLSRMGVPVRKLRVAGALQEQTQPPNCNQAERDDMAGVLGARPIWLALNVSVAEDPTVLAAQRQLMRKSHRLLLVLVPEDVDRAPDLAATLEEEGWVVALRSDGDDPTPEVQIYIADLPGEEALWMHLSPITFMGQTLSGGDCLAPNDPASLGSAVLFGPRQDRFADMFKRLEAAGAARKVRDQASLALEVDYLLQPENAAKMAIAAWDITTSGAELSGFVEGLVFEKLNAQGK